MGGDGKKTPVPVELSGTKQLELRKLDKEEHLEEERLKLESKKLDLEGKKIDQVGEDKKRDDRNAFWFRAMLWSGALVTITAVAILFGVALYLGHAVAFTAVIGTIGGVAITGLAIYRRQAFTFSGFGFKAGTTTTTETDMKGTTTTTTTTTEGASSDVQPPTDRA